MRAQAFRPVLAGLLAGLAALGGCDRTLAERKAATSQPAPSTAVVKEATQGPVKVKLSLDRTVATVPETLTLELAVRSEIGVEVKLPEIGPFLGDFAVKAQQELPAEKDDMTQTVRRVLTLETIVPGNLQIPEVIVGFADRREKADGSNEAYEDKAAIAAIPVLVHPGLADVKGPVALPWPRAYAWLVWTLAAIAVAATAGALLRRWMLRRGAAEAPARPIVVPAHVWALAELDILAAEALVERGRLQEFYYRINAIVRGYIERRFGLMAGEQTSEEFVRAMRKSPLLAPTHKDVLGRFVASCDPVKYARQIPDASEVEWVQATARDFVLETAESSPAEREVEEAPA